MKNEIDKAVLKKGLKKRLPSFSFFRRLALAKAPSVSFPIPRCPISSIITKNGSSVEPGL